MAHRNFEGGPWSGRRDDDYKAVPSVRIPVYADAVDFEGQCGDEQVTQLLGHYERAEYGGFYLGWYFDWKPVIHGNSNA